MSALIPGYLHDVFISYRHRDNLYDRWVSVFVANLKKELAATFKDQVSVYFDENPDDGLHELHDVKDSLEPRVKSLVFIPILSKTYCDPSSFAWQNELLKFKSLASRDKFGLKIRTATGNVMSRILPVRIHALADDDIKMLESELGSLRSIDLVFRSAGINRPLTDLDTRDGNEAGNLYRDQLNKVANAVWEIITAMRSASNLQTVEYVPMTVKRLGTAATVTVLMVLAFIGYFVYKNSGAKENNLPRSIAILPFRNNTGSTDLDYYGIGMASEIRTKLSMTREFDFISSLQATLGFLNSDKSPRQIGNELGVDYILTGIYQKQGDKIKVEAEFVEVDNGRVVWLVPFESRIEDIFHIQSVLAGKVASRFSSSPETSRGNTRPTSLAAYAHYSKGNQLLEGAYGDSADFAGQYDPVIEQYRKAIQADSAFIDAWADLIGVESYLYMAQRDSVRKNRVLRYMRYVDARFDECWQKKLARGHVAFRVLGEYDEALELMLSVLDENPQNVHATYAASSIYRRKLQLGDALKFAVRQINLSPGHAGHWKNLAIILSQAGDDENAYRADLKAWTLSRSKVHADDVLLTALIAGRSPDDLPDELRQTLQPEIGYWKSVLRGDLQEAKRFSRMRKKFGLTAHDCFRLEEYDSALFYWNLQPDEDRKNDSIDYFAFRRERTKAFDQLKRTFAITKRDSEGAIVAQIAVADIHIMFREYDKATAILQSLHEKYPAFHGYGIFNLPSYDHVKKAYPPFEKTLKQLIGTPSVRVSDYLEL